MHGDWYQQSGGTYSTYQPNKVNVRKALTLSPLAYLKLQYMCQHGGTEVGGFGVTLPGQPLYVKDFMTLPQTATAASFEFDEGAQADFVMTMAERGVHPENSSRIWIHTHPGNSPQPSGVDEDTLDKDFADQSWVVMFIMARLGATYARLRYNNGPGGDITLPVEIDWKEFPSLQGFVDVTAEMAAWEEEYQKNIRARQYTTTYGRVSSYYGRTAQHSAAPGYGVPAALAAPSAGDDAAADDPSERAATLSQLMDQNSGPASAAPERPGRQAADLGPQAGDAPSKKAAATRNLYDRVEAIEREFDTFVDYFGELQDQVSELYVYREFLAYLHERCPEFDGLKALDDDDDIDDAEVDELREELGDIDGADGNDFAALNRLRAQERHDDQSDFELLAYD